MALKDVAAFLVGAAALLIALGFHAQSNGGQFKFFQPQVDVIRSGIVGSYKIEGYEWLRSEPRLLVPVFLVVVAAPLLALGRGLPPFRFAAGAIAGLVYLTAVIYGWEFFAGGSVLEYTYYFSYFASFDRTDDGFGGRAGHLSRSVALAGERRSRSGGNDRCGGRARSHLPE